MAKKTHQGPRANEEARPEPPPGVKLLRTLEGHQDWVASVAFDPQGEMLASGSNDKTVKLWEVRSGKLLRTLEGHEHVVWSVAFDPQGGMLASGSDDQTVKLWEARGGKLLHTFDRQSYSYSVAFDPEGGALASGSSAKTVKLWKRDKASCSARSKDTRAGSIAWRLIRRAGRWPAGVLTRR